jgi:uncharacterized integral membrane protein
MTTQPQPPTQPVSGGTSAAPDTPAAPAGPSAPAGGGAVAPAAPARRRALPRTRLSGVWTALALFAVVLLLLLIFILQNSRSVEVSYLGAHGHLPLGVALLLAAVCGVLLVSLAGGARILELRATARRRVPPPPPADTTSS